MAEIGGTRTVRALISVINWNTSQATLKCVNGLLRQELSPQTFCEIVVTDNGSVHDDYIRLRDGLPPEVTLQRNGANLGFAGGHNWAIRFAMSREADFVWLVNSDAELPDPSTLTRLVAALEGHADCGAVSPMLADKTATVYFAGGEHDWERRKTTWPPIDKSKVLQESRPTNRWLSGAAIMLRTAAIREVGLLNEIFFAYYEDNDLCARLTAAGWTCRVAFDAIVQHSLPKADSDRPSYYFYLMQRNYLLFWSMHTPRAHRKLLRLRLLDQAFFECNKLYRTGFPAHGDASLLGIYDFLRGRGGAPVLSRRPPWGMVFIRKLVALQQSRAMTAHLALEAQTAAR